MDVLDRCRHPPAYHRGDSADTRGLLGPSSSGQGDYKMTEQAIKEMRIHLRRFVSEVRAGTISLEEKASPR